MVLVHSLTDKEILGEGNNTKLEILLLSPIGTCRRNAKLLLSLDLRNLLHWAGGLVQGSPSARVKGGLVMRQLLDM
ncbi:hypothetical protein QJS10_CPA09g01006 [Acorus calamus]|uniref:Uncharacterized protein n=1 Tax=Acorus calamus TaxID=4465 RepID=A0AAV9E945_ACOCL|nr:hypothetical protein QJS10_CPA09g01006 [Acorus calamus]